MPETFRIVEKFLNFFNLTFSVFFFNSSTLVEKEQQNGRNETSFENYSRVWKLFSLRVVQFSFKN